jgi:adenylosuccinate synthase
VIPRDVPIEATYDAMAAMIGRGDVIGARELLEEVGYTEKQKIALMERATWIVSIHTLLREELIVSAEQASPHADRQAMARACEVPASTFYRWLARRGLPRNRRKARSP